MSFTTQIKNEIARLESTKSENIAELSAFLRNNGKINKEEIALLTENAAIARRLYKFIKELYDVTADVKITPTNTFHHKSIYSLTIKQKISIILEDLSYQDSKGNYLIHPANYIVDSEEEIKAYLRGSFLSTGSINDPKTSRYHLEFLIDKPEEAIFVQRLLNTFDFNAKLLDRDKGYMIYMKEAEKIGDFLRLIKAYNAVMYYEDIVVYRDHKNRTNRLNNCEQANIDKVIATATEQMEHIKRIEEKYIIDNLDDKLKEAITYRLKYPDTSLQELSEIISLETGKKITKSGLNHRFRKIKMIAEKIKTEK